MKPRECVECSRKELLARHHISLLLFPQGATQSKFSISIHFLTFFWPKSLKVTSQILTSHITSGMTGRRRKSKWAILTPSQSPAEVHADMCPKPRPSMFRVIVLESNLAI